MSDIEVGSVWVEIKGGAEITVTQVDKFKNGLCDISFVEYGRDSAEELEFFLNRYKPKINKPTHERTLGGKGGDSKGLKDDSAKRRYSLLPVGTVNSVVDVLEAGAIKYSADNWQVVPNARTRYYDAAMRHLDAWFNSEISDDETGLPHLAHAICCLMFLMWFDFESMEGDK